MTAESRPIRPDDPPGLSSLPPVVHSVAARFAWVTASSEPEALTLLSRPFLVGVVTHQDCGALQARFPFMTELTPEMTREDYTILLVTLWLQIEAIYHRGAVMPDDVMKAFVQKEAATREASDCREDDNEPVTGLHP